MDVKKLIKQAEAQGWRVERRSRHIMCYAPDGVSIVTLSATPSDHRSMKNGLAQMRRAGLRL